MNLQEAFKHYPRECKIVIEDDGSWKLSAKSKKYQKTKTRRHLNEEDLGWMSFCWIIRNLESVTYDGLSMDNDDILHNLLEIIAINNTKPKKKKFYKKRK